MELEEYNDSELWVKLKTGDRHAFKTIYFKYYKILYNYGFKISSNSELTEDSIQDLFLKIWKNRAALGDVNSVKSYLYTSLSRILLELIKKQKRSFNSADLQIGAFEKSIEEIITKNQEKNEEHQSLQVAINKLSKRQKEIIDLLINKGLSYKEASEVIPVKYQTIRNCLHEAIKVLRKHMISTTQNQQPR
jgi:RNA polymerase sigma factor (sigma-70 family)